MSYSDNNTHAFIKNTNQWENSRRKFIKISILGGLISQIPIMNSCLQQDGQGRTVVKIGGFKQELSLKVIQDLQNILFPKDELGPGANELGSDNYLIWVLNDQLIDPEETEYIIKGFTKLNEVSNNQFGKEFDHLKTKKQEELVEQLSVSDWGEKWFSRLITLIIESIFANPNYGSNPDGIGWKWLNHQAGYPQPTKEQIYPTLLNLKKEAYINSIKS